MAIPQNITRENIITAIARISLEEIPVIRLSDRYFLIYDGKKYPPKYILSIANEVAVGFPLDSSLEIFNTYDAQDYLIALGFEILDKKTNRLVERMENRFSGFKLISLEVSENQFLGSNYYSFIEMIDQSDLFYTTVLIGPNGTGKSNLFRVILELFRELYSLSVDKGRLYKVNGEFHLKFSLNGTIYTYSNFKHYRVVDLNKDNNYYSYLLKNGQYCSPNEAILPIAIVANSIMLTDKYPILNKEDGFPMYKYLGLRNKYQNASSQSYIRRTIDFIVEQKDSTAFRKGLDKTAKFLNLSEGILVIYRTAYSTKFFNGQLSPDIFRNYFATIEAKYIDNVSSAPFKLSYFLRIKDDLDLIQNICDFNNRLVREQRLVRIEKSSNKNLIYNITEETSFQSLKSESHLLEHLRLLGIIYAPEIKLQSGNSYSLQESSSGEFHFLSSMVGLMATVKANSLVFIDEPEISLHPNWQMKYLNFLYDLFGDKEYGTCHFVIASHSHFIISDLKGESSKIIGLTKENNVIRTVDLPQNLNTYGWSAEEVLYSIFKVRSTRNYYLEYDITQLIGLINHNSNDFTKIRKIISSLEPLQLSDNDPLKVMIEDAEKYLRKRNA